MKKENFIERLHEVKTFSESIGKVELESLTNKLIVDYECEDELESMLILFFSLNAADAEMVLKNLRERSIHEYEEDRIGIKFLKEKEKHIAKMITKMDKISQKEVNKPFHLAAALGQLNLTEKVVESFNIDIKELMGKDNKSMSKAIECPYGSYPRYVSKQWPWKLKLSFNTTTKQRKEDVGCHFDHGPFKGTIRGWVSFSPQVMLMVLLQGWGFKLAANNNHFFYKWWFVIAVGLTPYSCQWTLFSRKY